MTFHWPEETVNELKVLAEQGYSAAVAASYFKDMSRAAASGIAHRHGFHFKNGNGWPNHKTPEHPPKAVAVEYAPIDIGGGLTIKGLHSRACKWIDGDPRDPDHRYCGQPTIKNGAWCRYHRGIAYTPRER